MQVGPYVCNVILINISLVSVLHSIRSDEMYPMYPCQQVANHFLLLTIAVGKYYE